MGRENRTPLTCTIPWLQGLWIAYLAEKYEKSWTEVVAAVIRHYATKDTGTLNIDDLKRFVLDQEAYKKLPGTQLLQLLSDVDTLAKRRQGVESSNAPTAPYRGRTRRIEWPVGRMVLTLNWLEYAIIDFYADKSRRSMSAALRMLLQGYVVSDRNLRENELRDFIDNCKPEIPKEEWPEIEAKWAELLQQRQAAKTRKAARHASRDR